MKNTNRFALVATLALSAIAAQAGQDFTSDHYPPEQASRSTLTRAQVVSDYKAAQANGSLPSEQHYLDYPNNAQQRQSTLTRNEVRNEAIAQMKDGGLSYGG